MSGVCAAVSRSRTAVDPRCVEIMIAAAPHRATGGIGRHLETHAALAQLTHRNAVDLGTGPVVHRATGVTVVADARIDNGDELRRALGTSAPPSTAGAAAVIAAAYLRWDLACLPRLLGDFAVTVWDPRVGRLLMARDPLAMRALYYRLEPDRALVATEVAQLLAVPGVADEPDERMIAAYLCGSFGSLDWTYQRGIEQVAPSHAVTVTGTEVRTWRYWDVDPDHHIEYAGPQQYADHLRELYLEAVRARLAGGRPAGVLLSGGIDSGAAASAAGWLIEQQHAAPRLYSYSWDYGRMRECDERHVSRHIVERYGIHARDVPVEDAGPLGGYPAHAPDQDDPFHGHFQTMLDRGFAAARDDGVGPLFTGMRGDLCIGPLDADYETLLASARLPALLGELRRHRAGTADTASTILRRDLAPAARRVAKQSVAADWLRWAVKKRSGPPRVRRSREPDHSALPAWIDRSLSRRVDLAELLTTYAEVSTPELDGPLRRRRYQWIFMPMHLRWAVSHERRAARFGLEAVDAWSDRRIAEFCVAVPQQAIDQPFATDKQLARTAMEGVMPAEFLRTAGKTVPTPLYLSTLRDGAVPAIRELLTNSHAAAAGWVDPTPLRGDYERFLRGAPLPDSFWWAISLEWWCRARTNAEPLDVDAGPRPGSCHA